MRKGQYLVTDPKDGGIMHLRGNPPMKMPDMDNVVAGSALIMRGETSGSQTAKASALSDYVVEWGRSHIANIRESAVRRAGLRDVPRDTIRLARCRDRFNQHPFHAGGSVSWA